MSSPISLRGLLVAAGFAALLAPAAQAETPQGNAQRGKTINSMCIGCHGIPGYHTAFPTVYKVPKIAGQDAAYLVKALQAYKAGDRKHGSMRAISGSLSDQDMADLAAFYSQPAATRGN